MTKPKCAACRVPHGCCAAEYCEVAITDARDIFGLDLPRTSHPKLPLMGATGCTAPPHTRVMCTFHTCRINSIGAEPGDPAWNEKYFALREEADNLSFEHYERRCGSVAS